MSDSTTTLLPVAGLDVHPASIRLAAVCQDELLDERTLPFDCQLVERELRRLGVGRICHEAGPTGFGLARHLRDAGRECDVIAPGLVPRHASDRRRRATPCVSLLCHEAVCHGSRRRGSGSPTSCPA